MLLQSFVFDAMCVCTFCLSPLTTISRNPSSMPIPPHGPIHLRELFICPFAFLLVRSGSCLARFHLIQIPPTNGQVPLISIHAPREALYILCTRVGLLLLLLISASISSLLRIVESIVHRLRIRILCGLLVLILCWFWLLRR